MAKVLVLCGGENFERRVSQSSGDAVARGLASAGHEVVKVDTAAPDKVFGADEPIHDNLPGPSTETEVAAATLDREGWRTLIETLIAQDPDAVFPVLHGGWGEDGRIQSMLELLKFPYLGSGPLASGVAMNKWMARGLAYHLGIHIPYGFLLHRSDDPASAFTRIEGGETDVPVVVKPNLGGSTVGLVITDNRDEFIEASNMIHENGDDVLVEEYIPGKELTVSILDGEALPVLEIRPKTGLYDYTRKYTKGETEYLCPAPLDEEIALPCRENSAMLFAELGCRHLARVDWRLNEGGALYLLELNTMPGMTDLSLVPMAAQASGLDFPSLMNQFLEMTIRDR
jgi:D-alanine-D-alanine ligase